jgi:hypothetical protein
VDEGQCKTIGLSNINLEKLQEIVEASGSVDLQWLRRDLQYALTRSDRDLAPDLDDVVTGKFEKIAEMHGVSLHRGK